MFIKESIKKNPGYDKSFTCHRLVEAVRTPNGPRHRLRSARNDLDEKGLWSLYIMLTQVEDAFRCMKTDLGMRPVYHRKDRRQEGHLFITVLAYHLLASIQRELKKKGIAHRWGTIRNQLAKQLRVTASLTNDKGKRIHIRQTTDPEPFQYEIYRALGLPPKPLRAKRLRM
jgi:hypothetical protein